MFKKCTCLVFNLIPASCHSAAKADWIKAKTTATKTFILSIVDCVDEISMI